MNDQMDYDLYVMAEISYSQAHDDIDEDELFPIDWYHSKNYMLKTEIIAEALEKNIMIEETELYNGAVEKGVFYRP